MPPEPQTFHRLSKRLPGQRAFITGAASGLGLELTRLLATAGWTVGMFDYNQDQLQTSQTELQAQVKGQLDAFHGDVSKTESVHSAIDHFVQTHGGLDLLINNAGIICFGSFSNITPENWNALLGVNLMGVIHGCKAALPHMMQAQQGFILNIASVAAFIPGISPPYSATKAAVLSLTEWLFVELLESPIQVMVALPGLFRSNIMRGETVDSESREKAEQYSKSPIPNADDVAASILKGVSLGQTYIFCSRTEQILWTMKRLNPLGMLQIIKKFLARSARLTGIDVFPSLP